MLSYIIFPQNKRKENLQANHLICFFLDVRGILIIQRKVKLIVMNSQPQSDSQGSSNFAQPNQVLAVKEEPEEQLEKKIMQSYEQEQKKSGKVNILSEDVEFKLEEVLEDIREDDGKSFQSIITLRMKELAYSKIMVLTYEKSYFRLVKALFHIGKQYLKFNCFEQALAHLDSAITKNVKAFTTADNQWFHSYLLTAYGQAFYRAQRYKEAEVQLEKALNLQKELEQKGQVQQEDTQYVNNAKTLTILAKVKAEQKNEESIKYIEAAIRKAKQVTGVNSRTCGLALYDWATILRKLGKKQDLVKIYEEAIKSIKMSNEPEFQVDIIKIYQDLATYYKNAGNTEKVIETMKERFQIFEDTYGNADKKAIKEQRALATALLNFNKIDQALDEFDDILQKSQKVYGQNSLQVGKEYKAIGNIYIIKGDAKLAQSNFKKAMKIFHDLGEQRLAKEIRMKISSIQVQ